MFQQARAREKKGTVRVWKLEKVQVCWLPGHGSRVHPQIRAEDTGGATVLRALEAARRRRPGSARLGAQSVTPRVAGERLSAMWFTLSKSTPGAYVQSLESMNSS